MNRIKNFFQYKIKKAYLYVVGVEVKVIGNNVMINIDRLRRRNPEIADKVMESLLDYYSPQSDVRCIVNGRVVDREDR